MSENLHIKCIMRTSIKHYKIRVFIMRIDNICWSLNKRICVSVDDDLFNTYCKFIRKREDIVIKDLREKIKWGQIKNSAELKKYFYSELMKPSAFQCYKDLILPDQVDIEDAC